jgi:ABC-type polysaccharide/polyol phosphate transport system ATPase subunit
MGATAIEAVGLSKRYVLGSTVNATTVREALMMTAGRLSRRSPRGPAREIWALRGVSFEVVQGECFGIIGRNGSGKSTLLKILTRITDPTEGTARVRGRVGALLEVGAGFHHELTGRENVFLAGAVLGMSTRDVQRRFDDIVDFSGVRLHIDTPVKRYSSGMYLRLAFSVAAHLERDVLIVDEALTVGDAEFQRRCFDRVEELIAAGTTVLYVSHDLSSVTRLCERVLWLERGSVRRVGPARAVVGEYLAENVPAPGTVQRVGRSESVAITRLEVRSEAHETITDADGFTIVAMVELAEALPHLEAFVVVESIDGQALIAESATAADRRFAHAPGAYELRLRVPPLLAAGEYVAGVWVYGDGHAVPPLSAATRFAVVETFPSLEKRLLRAGTLDVLHPALQ